MDSLQTDSTLHTFLFHLRVCGPHMNFRQVDCEALARTAASNNKGQCSLRDTLN